MRELYLCTGIHTSGSFRAVTQHKEQHPEGEVHTNDDGIKFAWSRKQGRQWENTAATSRNQRTSMRLYEYNYK